MNIHTPSDSRQLTDSIRVKARNIEKARKVIEKAQNKVVEKDDQDG